MSIIDFPLGCELLEPYEYVSPLRNYGPDPFADESAPREEETDE